MSVLPSETFQLIHLSHDWLVSRAKDVERWLSKNFGIAPEELKLGILSTLLASGALLYFWRARAGRRARLAGAGRKPPIVSYWMPWVGSALQVQRDPDSLFRRAHRELGPIFGVKAFGSVIYHVTDADLITSVYKHTAIFSGSPMQATFLHQIFDVRMEVIMGSNILGDMLVSKNRHLSPANVHQLVSSFIEHTRCLVLKHDLIADNASIPLHSLIIPLMQKADCAMLFGSSFLDSHYDAIAPAFVTFDTNVPLLAVNFPPFLMRGTIAARQLLIDRLTEYFRAGPPDDASAQLKEFVELGQSADWNLRDLASFALGIMWPLLANAPYAVYWLLVLQLHRPEGLDPVLEEIKSVLSSGRDLTDVVRDSSATPYLDACINETIRIASDSYSMRWVPQPDTGSDSKAEARLGGYAFTGGEQVVCNMREVHMDEDIYPNPDTFEPLRFKGPRKEVVRGRFFPFGGGFSICEGRHLALAQIKAFIIILLSEFDVSLVDKQGAIPKLSPSNRGFGMIRPLGDVDAMFSERKLV